MSPCNTKVGGEKNRRLLSHNLLLLCMLKPIRIQYPIMWPKKVVETSSFQTRDHDQKWGRGQMAVGSRNGTLENLFFKWVRDWAGRLLNLTPRIGLHIRGRKSGDTHTMRELRLDIHSLICTSYCMQQKRHTNCFISSSCSNPLATPLLCCLELEDWLWGLHCKLHCDDDITT